MTIISHDAPVPAALSPRGRTVSGAAAMLLAASLACGIAPLRAATVEVRFSGLPNDDGHALFALFAEASGFPDRAESAVARIEGSVSGGRADVVFENVMPGDYALSALHDANESGAIDLNLFGVPKEKFAVSNVAKGRPTWPQARFSVGEDDLVIELEPLRFY